MMAASEVLHDALVNVSWECGLSFAERLTVVARTARAMNMESALGIGVHSDKCIWVSRKNIMNDYMTYEQLIQSLSLANVADVFPCAQHDISVLRVPVCDVNVMDIPRRRGDAVPLLDFEPRLAERFEMVAYI